LKAVREDMIRSGLARTTINARIHRIRRAFRWAASVEMIPGAVVVDLETVEALAMGRSDAREADPVEPVPMELVEATLPFLPRPVSAMVQLQLLTGCRAGEVMGMRGCDLVPGDPTWEYRPARHKTSWRGKSRIIPLGPKAQAIVREFLKADTTAYLFDPRTVVNAHFVKDTQARYDRRSYRQAVVRACDRASVHPEVARLTALAQPKGLSKAEYRKRLDQLKAWKEAHAVELRKWRDDHRWSPLQLRHAAATAIRSRYGLETTSNVLGHARADVTQIYAERDLARARAVAAEIG
jgi:integrase